MTTEQPASPRLLRRRSDDRVLGGVASGLGDFLNVDPLLIRIGFVGLMVFGGLGLLLYVAGWLLVPEESSDESIVEDLLRRTGLTPTRWLVLMIFVLGCFILLGGIGAAYGGGSDIAILFGGAIVVAVVGGALLSYSGRISPIGGAPAAAPTARPAREARPAAPSRPRVRRRPRRRSPLAWYVLGGVLLAIGTLALVTNAARVDVQLAQYFGLVLAVIGVGLVIGTWWGHARTLILLGTLLLPFAFASTFVTAPIEGGLGFHRFGPVNADELRPEYRLLGGRMELDLRGMAASTEPIEIAASVTAGELHVLLPSDASVVVDLEVGAGELGVLDDWRRGSGMVDRLVREGDGSTFHLDLELGIGSLWLDGMSTEDR